MLCKIEKLTVKEILIEFVYYVNILLDVFRIGLGMLTSISLLHALWLHICGVCNIGKD